MKLAVLVTERSPRYLYRLFENQGQPMTHTDNQLQFSLLNRYVRYRAKKGPILLEKWHDNERPSRALYRPL
ncbi:hypothetical protein [Parapedobacter tibetensis]|uniref:hypothetical protein n=1 Tax=Parapedobacter tibetensis TaxID=2972951 RepID=UPI0021537C19|nr:hypothetical protein [Parapedobacter tibetensis]